MLVLVRRPCVLSSPYCHSERSPGDFLGRSRGISFRSQNPDHSVHGLCLSTYAFTVSNASAAFVKRRTANSASSCLKNSLRSALLANSTATPLTESGASVPTARNSEQLNPRKPGRVAQPNWYIMASAAISAGAHKSSRRQSPKRRRSPRNRFQSSAGTNLLQNDQSS